MPNTSEPSPIEPTPTEPAPKQQPPVKQTAAAKAGNLKGLLTGPYSVAAIASLSFHAILFAAVPRFSSASFAAFSDENINQETRTVPLVSLSAEEQGRLPNFNRPQLPTIPNLPSTSTPTSPRSLPTLPPRPNLPSPTLFGRPSTRLTTPPTIGSTSQLNRNRPFRNPYIPRPRLPITNTPARSNQSSERRTAVITDIPTPPPSPIRNSTLSDDEVLKLQQQIEAEQAAAENGTGEENNIGELPDGLEPLPENGEETPAEATPGEPTEEVALNDNTEQLSRLAQLQAKFEYNEENTSDEELEANYTTWVDQTDETSEIPIETVEEKAELPVESGFSLCVANPPTNGEVGVLVAPDGTASNAEVLRSTGYDHINQAAVAAILEGEYPEAETALRYSFDLVVNYDAEACSTGEEILETAQTDAGPTAEN